MSNGGDGTSSPGQPKSATDDGEPEGLDLFFVSLLFLLALIGDCIYQHRPAAAYGLALVSVAAVVATPNLVFNTATVAVVKSELRGKLAAWVRRISVVLCVIGGTVVALFLGISKHHHIVYASEPVAAVIVVTGALVLALGTYGLAIWFIIGLGASAGDADRSARAALTTTWHSIDNAGRRWSVAGLLFFIGTLIQFFNV